MGRKVILGIAVALFYAVGVNAQDVERVDAEKVNQFAKPLAHLAGELKDPPLKIVPNVEKATAIHKGEYAVLVIPDEKISKEAVTAADRDIVPVGYLMAHKLTPIVAETARPLDQHATVEIEHDGKKGTVAVICLGVGKVGGRLVLLLYTNEKAATHVVPLVEENDSRDFPVDVEALPAGNSRAAIVVHLFGKHKATFHVAPIE